LEWWQAILVVLGAIALGLGVGFGLSRLVTKMTTGRRASVARPVSPVITVANPVTLVQPPPSVPDLFAEIEHNRRLASSEWSGQLQSFITRAWENRGEEVHSLSADIRNELTEAYSDMALANSITWLSTEMSRRSPSLDESYTKLRNSVAIRLNRIHEQLAGSKASSFSPSHK
jgi:ABC-type antimicrobial peptide transport system permease subunit